MKIFLDVDDLENTHILQDNVRNSKNFLLLITEGVFERPFVQLEIQTALESNKNIILVHDEKSCPFPSSVPDHIKAILYPKAIPYYRDKEFREVSIKKILSRMVF